MPVPSTVADLSTVAGSNSPAGGDAIGTTLDDYLRAHAAIIKQVSDAKLDTGSNAVSATTATGATNININATTSTDTVTSVVLVAAQATGNQLPFIDAGLTYNANTNALTATTFVGNLSGGSVAGTTISGSNSGMPKFAVCLASNFSLTSGVSTKIPFDTKIIDTATAFDAVTNYRFNPQIAGYYSISANIFVYATSGTYTNGYVRLYKNGASIAYMAICQLLAGYSGINHSLNGTLDFIYMNGSTDYLELYCAVAGTSPIIIGSQEQSVFSGHLMP